MDRQKERVLIVHNYYQLPGGEDTVVANEKKMLENNGHTVILYTRENSELTKLGAIRKLLLPFDAVFNIKTYKDVRKLIKGQKIDMVHVHNTLSLISPSVYYAAHSMKVPIIQTVHDFRTLHILLCGGNGQELILCLLKRKHLLKFLLPDRVLSILEAVLLLADRI